MFLNYCMCVDVCPITITPQSVDTCINCDACWKYRIIIFPTILCSAFMKEKCVLYSSLMTMRSSTYLGECNSVKFFISESVSSLIIIHHAWLLLISHLTNAPGKNHCLCILVKWLAANCTVWLKDWLVEQMQVTFEMKVYLVKLLVWWKT